MSEVNEVSAHLTPEHWEHANRHLVGKALAEFAHERILAPAPRVDGYVVGSDDGSVEYTYRARVLALNHWMIDRTTLVRRRTADGVELPLDAVDLVLELRKTLGLSDDVLPVYLEEITSTLASYAYKSARWADDALPSAELAGAAFQTIEAGMTEGHPCFVAGSGRLGFDAVDYLRYAPETGQPVRLTWLAARRDHSTFTGATGVDHDSFVEAELGVATLSRFHKRLVELGLNPADYHLLPVHPWQWRNRLAVTFAGDVAARHLVWLGEGDDDYLAQQSIRTFFDASHPERHYVKTALSVLNMGFIRGLSAEYMWATPAINDWLSALVDADATLRRTGLELLRERAAIGYHQEQYAAAAPKGSPYRKMCAALWRESPIPRLADGERLSTMAALLHVDGAGDSLVGALIERSGLPASVWLRRYLDAYFVPVLHFLFAYDIALMPHGENVILVLKDDVPVRAMFKDIAEEIVVTGDRVEIPAEIERIRATIPDEERTQPVFTDVMDCFLRFLAGILDADGTLSEDAFWQTVAECVHAYQAATPWLADRFAAYDLFVEEFPLSCLNRLQLKDNEQMVDLADPSATLQFVGALANPLSAYRDHHAHGDRER